MEQIRMKNNRRLLPYPLIVRATNGDVSAINHVLAHYKGYINRLCTRPIIDDNGNVHMRVDPDMQARLESALIKKILECKVI